MRKRHRPVRADTSWATALVRHVDVCTRCANFVPDTDHGNALTSGYAELALGSDSLLVSSPWARQFVS